MFGAELSSKNFAEELPKSGHLEFLRKLAGRLDGGSVEFVDRAYDLAKSANRSALAAASSASATTAATTARRTAARGTTASGG